MIEFFVALGVVIIVLGIAKAFYRTETVMSHWHHRFDTQPFAPQEFYTAVETTLAQKGMQKLAVSRVTYAEGGILSPRREYLRIRYKDLLYDICAAPFGSGFFVSWWMGERGYPLTDIIVKIPVIGGFFAMPPKTFFELDTEMMFKESVSTCVRETIEGLTATKGMKNLTDAEWQYQNAYLNRS